MARDMSSEPSSRRRFRPTRRQLLVTGAVGVAVLGLASWAVREDGDGRADREDLAFLTGRDAAILGAIAPVLLAGALPGGEEARRDAVDAVVWGVDRAFSVLPLATQAEARQLLDLLGLAPARILLAGVIRPWTQASSGDIKSFLRSWRNSRFDLFRTAYLALHEVITVAWYGNPLSWPFIGYPGPPRI